MGTIRLSGFASLIVAALCCGAPALAQEEEVISLFGHGHGRGDNPGTPLLADKDGNLYGGTWIGGRASDPLGTAFELVRQGQRWSSVTLYNFDLATGGFPEGGLIAAGHFLFGTAGLGGEYGCGMVFELKLRNGTWRETTLHGFSGSDGCVPVGNLVQDAAGNLYGVTGIGGADSEGTVFELSRSGRSWSHAILYSFAGGTDGNRPQGIRLESTGTIYGTTAEGGSNDAGTVFQLTNNKGSWAESILHGFGGSGDGSGPSGGPVEDAGGNLYGTTTAGGADNSGTVYELSPSGEAWTETILYSFTGGADGNKPVDGVVLREGVLYGATQSGGAAGGGTVFKLTRSGSTWTETVIHSFPQPGGRDGSEPFAHPTVDSSGTIFGTTLYGGRNDEGTAYRIIEGAPRR